tara:strand:- start:2054 stop:2182 length:129 start_codon:yes stop_codon:yes gene_type:complete
MPIVTDEEKKDKEQLTGALVLVGIVGFLLFIVIRVIRKKKKK